MPDEKPSAWRRLWEWLTAPCKHEKTVRVCEDCLEEVE